MFISKKNIVLSIIIAILIVFVCVGLVYSLMKKDSEISDQDFCGTFQWDIRNISNAKYIAIYQNEKNAHYYYQWYNSKNEILHRGEVKIDSNHTAALYEGRKVIGKIVILHQKKYIYIDRELHTNEWTKLSKVPSVASTEG